MCQIETVVNFATAKIFDRDACQSGPKSTLVQNLLQIHGNLMFDKRQLKEAYKSLILDQIGSDDLRMT